MRVLPVSRLIVSLDFSNPNDAMRMVDMTQEHCQFYKVGLELFTAAGPNFVTQLRTRGLDVFLDLKMHDIPNTVAQAVKRACALDVSMLTVHALGGAKMMQAAADAANSAGDRAPHVLAVSVLTHHSDDELSDIGLSGGARNVVNKLVGDAFASGVHGCVCSPLEAADLRAKLGREFLMVTPGVRPAHARHDDQTRVATPKSAIADGANYLVVGRPIIQAADPATAARDIALEIASALG